MNTTSIMDESRVKQMQKEKKKKKKKHFHPHNDRKETNIHKVQKKPLLNKKPKRQSFRSPS